MLYQKTKKIVKPRTNIILIVLAGLTTKINSLKQTLPKENMIYFQQHRAILPTLPPYNMASILTGAPLEFHGVTNWENNRLVTGVLNTKDNMYPTFFYSIKKQKPDYKLSVITNFHMIKNMLEKFLLDDFIVKDTINYLDVNINEYQLLTIYDDEMYDIGVKQGFNTNEYASLLQEKVIAINEMILKNPQSTVIITSTSGGYHQGVENQGGLDSRELVIPLNIIDSHLQGKTHKIVRPTSNVDIASIIAYLIGVDLVQASTTNIYEVLHKVGIKYVE
ncbi:hypothetical protein [Spiroplasma endosymbiont of Eupeodes luniger]|uniref:hypothetical protein n=2 Tax=Spiroplasma endosymbiont of Eupeodes luniger TaxID=3066300 RepID=UPI0030CED98A